MCNPADPTPVVDGAASDDAVRRDTRSNAQRHHDGLTAALRAVLASGELGQHNGLPATIIVSTTLKELEAATGIGRTGGGSTLPMSDVIRIASHAHHYLAIFDKGKAVALYHTKRLASARTANCLIQQGAWLHAPRLRRARLLDRGPSRRRVGHDPLHRCEQAELRHARPTSKLMERGWNTRKRRQRRHRVDTTPAPRSRATPSQHLPPSRKATGRRRSVTET